MRCFWIVLLFGLGLWASGPVEDRSRSSASPPSRDGLSQAQKTALAEVERRAEELVGLHRQIWAYAEVGLEEHRSAAALVDVLRNAGFQVQTGVAGMSTAFRATYGSGKPVLGLLAEYDALPGLSQDVAPERRPLRPGAAGHACGHSALGTAAVGAALAAQKALMDHRLPGTIALFGTPAEETGIGKVYMLRAGLFRDLDVCLHWHPGTKNSVLFTSSKAVVSVRFTFYGVASHASASPEDGRSALDAVELMNIGVNYMREHVKEDARFHYVITDGGGQPNVVPPRAEVWYYIRADRHEDMERNYEWVADIAKAAAQMTRTKVEIDLITDNHELIPNRTLSELLWKNFHRIGPPSFSDEERLFARTLQETLERELGRKYERPLEETLEPLPDEPERMKGSTDVGDISWFVPTSGISVVCFVSQAPGHSWQNVATVGSSIGEKGLLTAAKVLAVSAAELFEQPSIIEAAQQELRKRLGDRTYRSLIPSDRTVPQRIR
jgi:aminobenzoyl-glutamate utilization protein B